TPSATGRPSMPDRQRAIISRRRRSSRRWRAMSGACCGPRPPMAGFPPRRATTRGARPFLPRSARRSSARFAMRARLAADFERFGRAMPRDAAEYIRDAYRIDLRARYLGYSIPHPIGKGSGQLSLNADQLETDHAAGLAFVVLKTVIAEDPAGERSMEAWAVHETRMKVEPPASAERRHRWAATWEGRGGGS